MKQCSFAIAAFLSATALTGAGLLAAPAAWAQTAQSPQTTQSASATSAVGDEAVVKLTAKIVKIDAASNSVAVKGPKGKTVVIDVDPATADVKKLKVGDEVHVAYREAVLMSADKVDPKGVRSRMTAESTSPASNGVVVKTREVQIVATIRKIDPASREVTLAGPQRTVSMTVSPDVDLSQFKVGDSILATYAAAMAIDVTRNGDVVR